jgi:succinate dehydrogenase/fumarate reductase flavoprotein subunit
MGAAGMMAALEAAREGAQVCVISKMAPRASNCTTRAWGGFTYCTDDTADELFAQVVETGGFLNNQELVEVFVQEVPHALATLAELGVEMDEPMLTSPAMPGMIRWSYRGKDAGLGMTEALRDGAEEMGAKFLHDHAATRVLKDEERVAGVAAADLKTMETVAFQARSVVIATGGGACAYPRTDNPPGATGDGIVLAYEAGAELADLECVSFQFPKQRVGEVFDAPEVPYEPILGLGHAHYFLGGIKIGESGQTTLPGLYAAGEATGGLFGAARLGGSALADPVIFGARAGRAAALAAREIETPNLDEEALAEEAQCLERLATGTVRPAELGEQTRQLLWRYCGTMKTAETLDTAVEELAALAEQVENLGATNGEELREAIEVRNIHRLGGLLARASLLREETRGCYWRVDHPEPDNEGQLRNIIIHKVEDGPELRPEPTVTTRITQPGEPRIGPGCFGYIERRPSGD